MSSFLPFSIRFVDMSSVPVLLRSSSRNDQCLRVNLQAYSVTLRAFAIQCSLFPRFLQSMSLYIDMKIALVHTISQSRPHRISNHEAPLPNNVEKAIRKLCRKMVKCANYRKGMQEKSRTYETMESLEQIANVHKKIHRMKTHQLHTQFENQWYNVQTTARGSNTITSSTWTSSPRSNGSQLHTAGDR